MLDNQNKTVPNLNFVADTGYLDIKPLYNNTFQVPFIASYKINGTIMNDPVIQQLMYKCVTTRQNLTLQYTAIINNKILKTFNVVPSISGVVSQQCPSSASSILQSFASAGSAGASKLLKGLLPK